jgi:hypothetical protein
MVDRDSQLRVDLKGEANTSRPMIPLAESTRKLRLRRATCGDCDMQLTGTPSAIELLALLNGLAEPARCSALLDGLTCVAASTLT